MMQNADKFEALVAEYEAAIKGWNQKEIDRLVPLVEAEADRIGYEKHGHLAHLHTQAEQAGLQFEAMLGRLRVRRQLNGFFALLLDGVKIGEVWNRHRCGGDREFGLRIEKVYWKPRDSSPNRDGGFSTTSAKTQRAAIETAAAALLRLGDF